MMFDILTETIDPAELIAKWNCTGNVGQPDHSGR